MARYDFKSLSPQDFEELSRDLLQAEWGVTLEAFKAGRDSGIDLRYSQSDSKNWVIQCKHFASSSFSNLLSHLRSKELPKVQRLHPGRYVVVTSLGLTPDNKDAIVAAMRPFILSPSDVISADDLNGMLSRHEVVEKANFKLWFTNTNVIERILHNAEVCQTQFEVERIRRKLPIFVQSRTYIKAKQILDEQRIAIISGMPGIGKTTLAEMLLFTHLDDGYEPVVIQEDISEGKRLFRAKRKQIFYYDDFLGQTFLGDHRSDVGKNHDVALLTFIEMVRNTPESRFILTTREHILRQALQASERLQHSATHTYKCVLELDDYSFGQRARILYNHLYFSDLPKVYKEAILEDDFFLEVIKHEHFNPRLIEWMVSLTRLNSPPADRYRLSIVDLLDSPERIWSHAFNSEISDAARDLLLTLYSLGEHVGIAELEHAFETIHKGACERYIRRRNVGDFRAALQELDGGFLSYRRDYARFLNPSIRDFTGDVLCDTPMLALELIVDATRFKQLSNLWRLSLEQGGEKLHVLLVKNSQTFLESATRFVNTESRRYRNSYSVQITSYIDTEREWRIVEIITWVEVLKDNAFLDLIRIYLNALLEHWKSNYIDFELTIKALDAAKESKWFMDHGGKDIYRLVLDSLLPRVNEAWSHDWEKLLELPQSAIEWTDADECLLNDGLSHYLLIGLDAELDNCNDVSEMSDFKNSLSVLNEKYSINLESEIAKLQAMIDAEENEDEDDGGGFSHASLSSSASSMTEGEVREMFQTLRN